MRHRRTCLVAVAAAAIAGLANPSAWAQSAAKIAHNGRNLLMDPLVATPVVWSVIATPVSPVKGTDGHIHLAYEMLFTNLSTEPARLQSIQVVDPAQNNRVVGTNRVITVKNEDATTQFLPLGFKQPQFTARLRPGRSAVGFLDVTFDSLWDVPRLIKHRVTVSQMDAQDNPVRITAVGGPTPVKQTQAIVLSPPLKGDRWVDGNGCCEIISSHRSAILPVNGTLRPPEHFAIDFVQLDAQGRAFTGDPKNLNNWHCYGTEVVAAAPGKVVEVVNDLPNQVPGKLPASVTDTTAGGNHVIIDMGQGRFAGYAHLIPGSITVGVEDVIARGQRLGRLGDSGNTDAPHLHFQVMNHPSLLDTDGLPFVFDRMALQGRVVGTLDELGNVVSSGGELKVNPADSGQRRREMPLTLDVLGFR